MDFQTAINNTAPPAASLGRGHFLLAFLLLSATATTPLVNGATPAVGENLRLSSSLSNLRGRRVANKDERWGVTNGGSPRSLQSDPPEEEFPNEVAIQDNLSFRYKLVSVDTADSEGEVGDPQEERASPPFNAISVEMVYQDLAWIGFAIAGPDGGMVGSEAIIGIPGGGSPNPGKYFLGGKSVPEVTLMDPSQQTLIDSTIEQDESSGETILTFTKLLDEPGELVINATEGNVQNTFLWAIGDGNELAYHGGGRGKFEVALEFDSGSVSEEPTASPTNLPETLAPTTQVLTEPPAAEAATTAPAASPTTAPAIDSPTEDSTDDATPAPPNSVAQTGASCVYNGNWRQPGEWLTGPTHTCMCDSNGSGQWTDCRENDDPEDDENEEDNDEDEEDEEDNDEDEEEEEEEEEEEDDEEDEDEDEDEDSSSEGDASCVYNGNWRQPGEWLTGPTHTCMCDSNGSGQWTDCRENDDPEDDENEEDNDEDEEDEEDEDEEDEDEDEDEDSSSEGDWY